VADLPHQFSSEPAVAVTAKEEVGGPGSMKPEHACDGKGIDYLDVCFGG